MGEKKREGRVMEKGRKEGIEGTKVVKEGRKDDFVPTKEGGKQGKEGVKERKVAREGRKEGCYLHPNLHPLYGGRCPGNDHSDL